jgi:hypothetical protein
MAFFDLGRDLVHCREYYLNGYSHGQHSNFREDPCGDMFLPRDKPQRIRRSQP